MPTNEPQILCRGKHFHKLIQQDWLATAKDGTTRPERVIRRVNAGFGRVDILVEDLGDMLSVIEIKSTDWDAVCDTNISRNVRRQIRQIWQYVDALLKFSGKDICPGVIFPSPPTNIAKRAIIESLFNEDGIQVVWHYDSSKGIEV